MSIVNKVAKSLGDVAIINIVAMPFSVNPWLWLWYSIIVSLAFLLRLAIERKKGALPGSKILEQTVYTISYCFFACLVWFTWLSAWKWFEVYLFLNSLFATFMVGELENIFKMGFKSWIQTAARKFLALEPGDIKANQKEEDIT